MSTRVRSVATSLASGTVELSVVALLHGLGAPAAITFSVVQLLGATITFTLNKVWVFDAAGSGSVAAELSRAAPVLGGSFVLNTVLPSLGTSVAGMPAIAAYLASQALVYLLWSFPLNRRWVFRMTRSCRSVALARSPAVSMVGQTLSSRWHHVRALRWTLLAVVFTPTRGRLLRIALRVVSGARDPHRRVMRRPRLVLDTAHLAWLDSDHT